MKQKQSKEANRTKHTNRIRRDFAFSHKGLSSVMKFLLHQIIIYVNIKPTPTQQKES